MKPGLGVNVIILSLNDANYTRTNQMAKNISVAHRPNNTVVKHLTHNPKIKGSKCATGMMSVKMAKKMFEVVWFYPSSMVVEHMTHNSKVEGSITPDARK